MRISVLMPTYNRAHYIAESLDSVFRQSRSADEVIVVDDGSTDDTAERVRQYRSVFYIRQENQGVAAARNYALAMATGDIIAWLDSDDLWEPAFLEATVGLLEENESIDGVYTGLRHIDDHGRLLEDKSCWLVPPEKLVSELWRANRIATPAVVARRSCYDWAGLFDQDLRICEDTDMWLRLAGQFALVGIPRELVRIRVHATNTMGPIEAFAHYRLLLVEKWQGRLDAVTLHLAYGYAFREIGFRYLAAGHYERGWEYIERAVVRWPAMLHDLDTLYELVVGEQPRGRRTRPRATSVDSTLASLETLLDRNRIDQVHRRAAVSNYYLALAMLNDQAGEWSSARRFMRRAIATDAHLLRSPHVLRRWAKLYAGQRVAGLVRSFIS